MGVIATDLPATDPIFGTAEKQKQERVRLSLPTQPCLPPGVFVPDLADEAAAAIRALRREVLGAAGPVSASNDGFRWAVRELRSARPGRRPTIRGLVRVAAEGGSVAAMEYALALHVLVDAAAKAGDTPRARAVFARVGAARKVPALLDRLFAPIPDERTRVLLESLSPAEYVFAACELARLPRRAFHAYPRRRFTLAGRAWDPRALALAKRSADALGWPDVPATDIFAAIERRAAALAAR